MNKGKGGRANGCLILESLSDVPQWLKGVKRGDA